MEVRTKNKEKFSGRLGAVSDSGFDFQYVQNNQAISRNMSFDEVRSVKVKQRGLSVAGKVTLGILAGLGVVFLVAILAVAASGGFDS